MLGYAHRFKLSSRSQRKHLSSYSVYPIKLSIRRFQEFMDQNVFSHVTFLRKVQENVHHQKKKKEREKI